MGFKVLGFLGFIGLSPGATVHNLHARGATHPRQNAPLREAHTWLRHLVLSIYLSIYIYIYTFVNMIYVISKREVLFMALQVLHTLHPTASRSQKTIPRCVVYSTTAACFYVF